MVVARSHFISHFISDSLAVLFSCPLSQSLPDSSPSVLHLESAALDKFLIRQLLYQYDIIYHIKKMHNIHHIYIIRIYIYI